MASILPPPPTVYDYDIESGTSSTGSASLAFPGPAPLELSVRLASETEWEPPKQLSQPFARKKNLIPGIAYEFRWRPAMPGAAWSNPLTFSLPAFPNPPTTRLPAPSISMELNPTDPGMTSATVSWPLSASPGVKTQVQLLVLDGRSEWLPVAEVSGNGVRKKSIDNGTNAITFRYRHVRTDGTMSEWSKSSLPQFSPLPSTLGSMLGQSLRSKTGMVSTATALAGKLVLLSFSAHWCPPCRQFTPQLVSFYNEMKRLGKPIEVVFVSADHSAQEFEQYYGKEMPYLAIPFENVDVRENLEAKFRIRGIPSLKVVSPTGQVIEEEGTRRPLTVATFDAWMSKM